MLEPIFENATGATKIVLTQKVVNSDPKLIISFFSKGSVSPNVTKGREGISGSVKCHIPVFLSQIFMFWAVLGT